MIGPAGCCCGTPDCPGFCADATNVEILVDLTGFADDTAVPNPPTIGSCLVCDDLNQTYTLVYGGSVSSPTSPCTTTDEDFGIEPCRYGGGYSCGHQAGTPGMEDMFNRTVAILVYVYVTNGGDRRGYIQVYYSSTVFIYSSSITYNRTTILADDFLIESGSSETDCLTFTRTGTLSVCTDSGGSTYDCDPPTDYSLSVVEV